MYRFIVTIAVLLAVVHSSVSYNSQILSKTVEGCSIASDAELGLIDSIKANTFQLNVAKKHELLRMKAYFKGLSPIIIIQYGQEQGMTFGQLQNSSTFAIYEKYSDFTASKQAPKITKSNAKVFSETYYTEMDLILTRDGRFSVIVHGYTADTFDLTFKKGTFINLDMLTVRFAASNGKSEKTRFLVDCPWKASYLWTVLPKA
ncbi:hypothetical protein ACFFRR_000589 [Megaselia abdita]